MAIAVAIGVPLGMAFGIPASLEIRGLSPLLTFFQNHSQLALFGFLIPLPLIGGIGMRSAVVALVLYALLPILRNTCVGLSNIDPAILEAAEAMGMTRAAKFYFGCGCPWPPASFLLESAPPP